MKQHIHWQPNLEGHKWSAEENRKLRSMFREGRKIEVMSEILQRTIPTVAKQKAALGLINVTTAKRMQTMNARYQVNPRKRGVRVARAHGQLDLFGNDE